ncbi:hypothetical protein Pint_06389 [Pistacia integerrima]|uniref:Uncharacterized protein n=2 Tax=Pistacia TaxID=55512 RepID=A0ACC1BNY7_9ROSI|nr:hypothetical protein Pint_06389 [Pistacia integerrima]KAJ0100787.1 hypothetical protein Patl1_06477 [Pistacia atlantica]
MAMRKRFQLFVLLLVILAVVHSPSCRVAEASRPMFVNHPGYSKTFASLGVECKCCDGEGGECTSTWEGSCSKFKCLPWKYVH